MEHEVRGGGGGLLEALDLGVGWLCLCRFAGDTFGTSVFADRSLATNLEGAHGIAAEAGIALIVALPRLLDVAVVVAVAIIIVAVAVVIAVPAAVLVPVADPIVIVTLARVCVAATAALVPTVICAGDVGSRPLVGSRMVLVMVVVPALGGAALAHGCDCHAAGEAVVLVQRKGGPAKDLLHQKRQQLHLITR
eukprot:2998390-Pleurochrysis_carterae.AAC.3